MILRMSARAQMNGSKTLPDIRKRPFRGLAGACALHDSRSHARARGTDRVRQLADWARRHQIEQPSRLEPGDPIGGAPQAWDFQNLLRITQLTLDLKSKDGRTAFLRMVRRPMSWLEFQASVKSRLGIDYATLRGVNLALVYARISGYGQTGP